jgi:hypothetical protein
MTTPSVVLATPVTRKQKENKKTRKKRKIWKIVAYGCQTPSAQRRSDQFFMIINSV